MDEHTLDDIHARYRRAQTQRMYLQGTKQWILQRPMDRPGIDGRPLYQSESAGWKCSVLGTQGSVYEINVFPNHPLTCTCIDYVRKKLPCKHIILLLHRVLSSVDEVSRIIFDESVFRSLPHATFAAIGRAIYRKVTVAASSAVVGLSAGSSDKPVTTSFVAPPYDPTKDEILIDDDCCICFEEVSGAADAKDKRIQCIEGCHKWFHKDCLSTWIQRHKTCPMCRTKLPASYLVKCGCGGNGGSGGHKRNHRSSSSSSTNEQSDQYLYQEIVVTLSDSNSWEQQKKELLKLR